MGEPLTPRATMEDVARVVNDLDRDLAALIVKLDDLDHLVSDAVDRIARLELAKFEK